MAGVGINGTLPVGATVDEPLLVKLLLVSTIISTFTYAYVLQYSTRYFQRCYATDGRWRRAIVITMILCETVHASLLLLGLVNQLNQLLLMQTTGQPLSVAFEVVHQCSAMVICLLAEGFFLCLAWNSIRSIFLKLAMLLCGLSLVGGFLAVVVAGSLALDQRSELSVTTLSILTCVVFWVNSILALVVTATLAQIFKIKFQNSATKMQTFVLVCQGSLETSTLITFSVLVTAVFSSFISNNGLMPIQGLFIHAYSPLSAVSLIYVCQKTPTPSLDNSLPQRNPLMRRLSPGHPATWRGDMSVFQKGIVTTTITTTSLTPLENKETSRVSINETIQVTKERPTLNDAHRRSSKLGQEAGFADVYLETEALEHCISTPLEPR